MAIGNNMVEVSWTPTSTTDTTHYMVMYHQMGQEVQSVTVMGGDASMGVVEGLETGVEYSITVQALGDLPGPVSPAATITLQGERECLISRPLGLAEESWR